MSFEIVIGLDQDQDPSLTIIKRFYSLERSSPLLDIGQKTWDMGLGTYDIGHGTCEISHWSSVMSYETWNKDIGHGIFEIR